MCHCTRLLRSWIAWSGRRAPMPDNRSVMVTLDEKASIVRALPQS